jgi:murein DD-endopeptidase
MKASHALDALCAAACLWAATYHTPAGALVRSGVAKVLGTRASSRPLLAYYSAGVYDEPPGASLPKSVPRPPRLTGPMAGAQALGYGAFAAMQELTGPSRAPVLAQALAHGVSREHLEDPRQGPLALAKVIGALGAELGSPEVALAALFCGADAARFARDRIIAEGKLPDLVALADALPPGSGEGLQAASRAASLGTAYALGWPVDEETRITSPFGMRLHPVLGTKKMHTGVDLGVPAGTSVRAAADGTVRRVSEDAVNGRVVIVDHGRGVTTAYCHNDTLLVAVGEHVARGQVLSRSGSTGRSTGPHLHYQLDLGGTPVDPLQFRVDTAPIAPEGTAASD